MISRAYLCRSCVCYCVFEQETENMVSSVTVSNGTYRTGPSVTVSYLTGWGIKTWCAAVTISPDRRLSNSWICFAFQHRSRRLITCCTLQAWNSAQRVFFFYRLHYDQLNGDYFGVMQFFMVREHNDILMTTEEIWMRWGEILIDWLLFCSGHIMSVIGEMDLHW